MPIQPVLHMTNTANVSVTLESDLATLPTQNYPDGTTIFARSSQKLFCWNPQSAAGTVAGVSVAVATGGAWLVVPTGASGEGVIAETRFVAKNGSDATGDGSLESPFLTIQAAITSITDATSIKPYQVFVAPGIYATAFVIQPWIFIVGFNRTTVFIQNASANWIGAGFAVAGAQQGGISECTLQTNGLVVDISAMSVSSKFFFYEAVLDAVGVSVTGIASTQQFLAQNIQQLSSTVLNFTVTNCPCILTGIELFNTNLNLTNTAAFQMVTKVGSITHNRSLTLTCNDITNFLSCSCTHWSTISAPIVIVGSGVSLLGRGIVYVLTLPDLDSTLTFITPVVGAIVLANEGLNLLTMTPTANRTLTVNDSNPSARLRIVNQSSAFFILLTGTSIPTSQTYIPPGGIFDGWRQAGAPMVCSTIDIPQYGTGVLVNGVSALIPADISANSSIGVINTNLNGSIAIGVLVALDADKVAGTRAGGGGFVIRSLTLAGAAVAADQSSFRWEVVRGN